VNHVTISPELHHDSAEQTLSGDDIVLCKSSNQDGRGCAVGERLRKRPATDSA
jgi:hypothetical protein